MAPKDIFSAGIDSISYGVHIITDEHSGEYFRAWEYLAGETPPDIALLQDEMPE